MHLTSSGRVVMRIVIGFITALLLGAVSGMVAHSIVPNIGVEGLGGVIALTFVLILVLALGVNSKTFFGTRLRTVCTLLSLGVTTGSTFVWSISGFIKPEQLTLAYIFITAVTTLLGLLISFYPDYPENNEENGED